MSGEQLSLEPAPRADADRAAVVAPSLAPPPATPEQRLAIASCEHDVLLEAGAGTGKTRVLVDRYCEAAEEHGVDTILAFTFTERAAGELRERIRAELKRRAREAAREGEGERAERLEELAERSETAQISTIHGFCRRLLASHAVAAGLDPRFRVLDEPETQRLAAEAFELALERFLEADADGARATLVAAMRVQELRAMVRAIHDELRSQAHEIALPAPVVPDTAAVLRELAAAATAALEETRDGGGRPDNLERLAAAAALEPDPDAQEGRIAALELLGKAKAFCGPACERYREAWRLARRAVVERDAAAQYRLIGELLGGFAEAFAAVKDERSGLDFEDLQVEARRLLGDHQGIADSQRERLRHVMVDEFQDTNRLQLELIRLLQGPETQVFCVGDEFQSIYGFRHADVEVFRRERERLEMLAAGRAAVLPLSGNFRSRPGIVAAVNAIGEALLDGFRPLTFAREGAGGAGPAVELLLTPSGPQWSAPELEIRMRGDHPSSPEQVAEARFLAAHLRELVEGGTERRDIVVLLRAYTHVSVFEEELERAGLRPYVVGGRGYWSQQQVEDVRRLLATVANPLDDESLLGALASPACAVLPDTLWLLRRAAGRRRHLWPLIERGPAPPPPQPAQDDGERDPAHEDAARWLEAIPADEMERLRAFRDTILGLRDETPLLPLDALVDRAVGACGYDLAVLSADRGPRRYANVRKMMRIAREYEEAEGRDLRGLLDFLAERAAAAREAEAATEAEDHDGVRVMTVHAAKGLEFGVVAVADLGRELLAGARAPAVLVDTAPPGGAEEAPAPAVGVRLARFGAAAVGVFGYDELRERAVEDEVAEACRLAYVAATRACDRLLLSGRFKPSRLADGEPKPSMPISERLMRALGADGARDSTLEAGVAGPRDGLDAPEVRGSLSIRVNRPQPEAFARLRAAPAHPAAGEGALAAAPPPLSRPPTPAEPAARALSYSALASYGRCGYRFFAERVVGLAPVAGGAGEGASVDRFAFGNAVHALLEWSGRRDWREPDAERCRELLRRERLAGDPGQVERARALLAGWLGSGLRRRLTAGDAQLRPEMPFVLELGGSIVRGTIDLLAVEGDVPLVVDYKTDRLGEASVAELVDRYGVQRNVYALAAASAGQRVRTAYVFLERPDEPVELELDEAALAAARDELERIVGAIRAGEFAVTEVPHAALCWDCPARARLCSHPREMTGRRLPGVGP